MSGEPSFPEGQIEARRQELNTVLAFPGPEYGADGNFRRCEAAQTLDEADDLSLISLLHRKLDECVPTGSGSAQ